MNSSSLRPGLLGLLTLLAGVTGPTRLAADDFHDNVVIVLDASGSMKDRMPQSGVTKIDAAKNALRTVLAQLPPSTHVGLLVFSARNVTNPWIYPLSPRNDTELNAAIARPEPYGNTPLGQYIKQGADRLLEERARQFGYGTYRLLVVTDGEAQDQDLVERYAPEVLARGITMDVIGVAMRQDHTLARKAHSYRRANDPAALQRAVAEVLAEVSKPRTDTAQADAFAELEPIPVELAAAAIQALSVSGNHPIGSTPKAAASGNAPAPAGAPPKATPTAAPAATTSTPVAAPPPPAPVPSHPRSSSRTGLPMGIVVPIIAIIAFARIARRIRRGR